MTAVLVRLPVLQMGLIEESVEDGAFLAPAILMHSIAQNRQKPDTVQAIKKAVLLTVRGNLDKRVRVATKAKRELLSSFLNTLPLINIPLASGRPLGSKKPDEKKAQEARELEAKIETIRTWFSQKSRMPLKTEVAEMLGFGGINPTTGTDTRLNSFNNKLRNLVIDYAAIVDRLRPTLNNSA